LNIPKEDFKMDIRLGTLLEDGIIDKGTVSAIYAEGKDGVPTLIWKGKTEDVKSFDKDYRFVDFLDESENSGFNKEQFGILVESKLIDFKTLDYSNDNLLISKYKMLLSKFDSNAMEAASLCFINHLKKNGIDKTKANKLIKTAFREYYIKTHGESDWKTHVENDKKYLGVDDESESYVNCDVEQVYGNENDLSEMLHLDTVLTKLFHLNESISLYHISEMKGMRIIKPMSKTVGNKLQLRPYLASWWTPNRNEMLSFSLANYLMRLSSDYERFGKKGLENLATNICDDAYTDDSRDRGFEKIYVSGDWANENKQTYDWALKHLKLYVYGKTFKMKELGRGNDFHIPEFTCDAEVTPDSEEEFTGEDIAGLGAVEILKESDFAKKKAEIDDFIASKSSRKDICPWERPERRSPGFITASIKS
jgi:hypothetical protein